MFFLFVGLALFGFLRVSAVSAHDPFVLDARRAAPGSIRLELAEFPLGVSNTKSYRLKALGMPRQVIFGLFAKDFSHSFHELAAGFHVNESGEVVSIDAGLGGAPGRLDQIALESGPYPKGAAWEVALMSSDRTIRAFVKAIPHPITAHDKSCTISLELVSQRGDRFIPSGTGFVPGEDVITESRYSGRVIETRQRISVEGRLLADAILHGGRSSDRSARYIVKGSACEVSVTYEWGEAALVRR